MMRITDRRLTWTLPTKGPFAGLNSALRVALIAILIVPMSLACGQDPPAAQTTDTSPRDDVSTEQSQPTGEFAFRLVDDPGTQFKSVDGESLQLGPPLGLAKSIISARASKESSGNAAIELRLNNHGRESLRMITQKNVQRKLAMTLGDRLLSAPVINEPIDGGKAVITGNWTLEEAQQLAHAIKPPTFQAYLMLVKSDWSTVDGADRIERELAATLENVPVPEKLRATLPSSATEIIFPTEMMAHYQPHNFAAFVAWLRARKLFLSQEAFPTPVALSSFKLANDSQMVPTYTTKHDRDQDFLGLALDKSRFIKGPPKPFVTHHLEMSWHLQLTLAGGPRAFEFERRLQVVEKRRGQRALATNPLDQCDFTTSFQADHIAVMRAFPSHEETEYQRLADQRGFLPLIVIVPTSVELPLPPSELVLPDVIDTIRVNYNSARILWQTDAEGTGGTAAATNATPSDDVATDSDEEPLAARQTVIVSLQNASAENALAVLQQVFAKEDSVSMADDTHSNSVILHGPEGDPIDAMVALLRRLDETKPNPDLPAREPGPGLTTDLSDLRTKYETKEREAKVLASQLREKYDGIEEIPTSERKKLEAIVELLFDTRQQLHEAELRRAEQRLREAKQNLARRRSLKETAVSQRANQLLQETKPTATRNPTSPDNRRAKGDPYAPSASLFDTLESEVQQRKAERQNLQGRWRLVRSKSEPMEIVIDDETCKMIVKGQAVMTGTVQFNSPRRGGIVMRFRVRNSQQEWFGSYELKGELLALRLTSTMSTGGTGSVVPGTVMLDWSGVYQKH